MDFFQNCTCFSTDPFNFSIELHSETPTTSTRSKSVIDWWKIFSNYLNLQKILTFITYCCESIFLTLQSLR